jgi:putative CocE/NonD family hydrolase
MLDRSAGAARDKPGLDESAQSGVMRQVGTIVSGLSSSPVARALILLIAAIVVIIIVTAYGQVWLNRWNKPFFDALSRRDFHDFLKQLGVFFIIATWLLSLNVVQRWLIEMLKVKLREGLVGDLLRHWLLPRRAFWLAHAGEIGVNPDQRVHEDARKFCELSADLGAGLLQATILFAPFAGLLWVLSVDFTIHVAGRDYAIPGFILWAAILYAAIGSVLSYRVGGSLIDRNAARYAREAELRFALVRVNEHLDGISLAAGEADERRRVEVQLANVLAAMRRLVTGLTNLTWITSGFGWVTIVAPLVVAAPLYFEGKITFGGLMMAAAAFTQAQSSLRWFVDNFSTIADWRATLLRVASFRQALTAAESLQEHGSRITYAAGDPDTFSIEDLEIDAPVGRDMLQEREVIIRAGEHVLIVGAPGTNKTLLFRALAGLWPWGAGRITHPSEQPIVYLPHGTPYLPSGTLREVLAYPRKIEDFDPAAFAHALGRLRLERLVPLLDVSGRWDRELSQEEQLCLSFARIVLQTPKWVLIDDALGALEDDLLERVTGVLNSELAHSAVIHIGRAAEAKDLRISRIVHLIKGAATMVLLLALLPVLARAQDVEFHPPNAVSDSTTPAIMRDLAERVLPVYQDKDSLHYLRNLSALQFVAGAYAAADATRQLLRERTHDASGGGAQRQEVFYDFYMHARVLAVTERVEFARAMRDSIIRLSDRDAYALTSWHGPGVLALRDSLQNSYNRWRATGRLAPAQAAELVWDYLAFDAERTMAPSVGALEREDDQRRYFTDVVRIELKKGLGVAAIVVRPKSGAQPLPTLLEFTIDDSQRDAKECAAHGYAAVIAYTRHRRPKGGGVIPYQFDGEDARAVISWIARQPWSDGRVGMYGVGYSGFTAWAAAKRLPPALKAIATASALAPGVEFPMSGNVPQNAAYPWALEAAGREGPRGVTSDANSAWQRLDQVWYRSGRPYQDFDRLGPAPSAYFHRWINHPSYDRFWQKMIPFHDEFAHIDIPVLAVTGYYDPGEMGTLYYWTQLEQYNPQSQRTLVIGPYENDAAQSEPAATLGGYAVDPAAHVDLSELRYQWFDYILKGGAKPSLLADRINYEVMGANEWRHAPSLAAMASETLRFYLDGADTAEDRVLALNETAASTSVRQAVKLADRSDVGRTPLTRILSRRPEDDNALAFVSAPLRQPLEINGLISGLLDFTVNKFDMDLSVALYEKLPDGTYLQLFAPAYEFRASYVRDRVHRHLLLDGERQQLQFRSERITSRKLQTGSEICLVLGIVKRPDREINYGTADNVSEDSIDEGQVPMRIRWYGSSYIELPVRR